MRLHVATILSLLLGCAFALGFAPGSAAQNYAARIYTEANGLPHQSIVDVDQTPDGQLWFSTQGGLVRYDCRAWEVVATGIPTSGPSNGSMQLDVDERGALWAFRQAPPFDCGYLLDGRWHAFERPVPDGSAPVGGLVDAEIAPHQGGRSILLTTTLGTMLLHDGDNWRRLETVVDGMFDTCVFDGDFVVTGNGGVHRVDARDGATTRLGGAPTPPMAIETTDDGSCCWMVGRTWIGRYGGERIEVLEQGLAELFYPDIVHAAVLPDDRGGLYFGERAGAFHYSTETGVEVFGQPNALDHIGLTRLFRDREGIIWGAGVRGVAKFAGRFVANRASEHGLAEDEVSAVLELQDGRILLGHNHAVTILESPPRTARIDERRNHARVMSMAQTADGAVYLAANRAGLLRLDLDTLAVEPVRGPHQQALSIQGVTRAPDGSLIVAGWRRVWRYDGERFEDLLPPDHELTEDYIRHATMTGDGLLLALRHAGILQCVGEDVFAWTGDDVRANNCYCVQRRPDGSFWTGTGRGVLRTAARGRLVPVDFAGQRIDVPVYFMADDRDGRTWFGTNNGVIIWDGNGLRHITEEQGLAGRETNRGAHACDRRGRMWVGFDRGLTTFDPSLEVAPRHGPQVSLLAPAVNGVVRSTGLWAPVVEHDSLSFRLRSISSRDEERLLHQHRLEGLEHDFSALAPLPDRRVHYESLPPGRYRLHVRATDSASLTAETRSPWIEVMPPWYRVWWFRLLVLVGVLTALGIVFAFWTQRRHARQLEDVVELRTADLSAERNRLQATLSSIGDGVVAIDDAGCIALWNETARGLTGWDQQQALGRHLDELMPGLSLSSPTPDRAIEITIADGSSRWFEYTVAQVADHPASGYVVAFRDVTDRREQDRLMSRSERLESLGVLAGGIAHDFNNLLTVMLGNLSLLELDDDHDAALSEKRQLREQIQEAVLRARDLTRQLLTFSKGGAPVRTPGSLEEVVAESARLALSGSNVRCELVVEQGLQPVEFDRGQIGQVVHNLVLNGRQAMPTGGTITVRTFPSPRCPNGHEIPHSVIEVRDEGAGISPGELERIFDPYYSTKPDGTGLGLATSHSIVKRHDGYLTVESRLGEGSTFRIYLPALADARAVANAPTLAGADLLPKGRRVLCMDDDASIRAFLRSSLTTLGHHPHLVSDGTEAIAVYRHARDRGRPFDFVLLDMTIPGGMGGVETLERLRELDPDVVAVAATGYSTDPVLDEFRRHGFVASLGKPFSVSDIADALTRAARGRAER
ncbi:MAG: ATP-binding protein [Planctomycetota bacterium]